MPRDNKDKVGFKQQPTGNPEFQGFIDFTITDSEHEAFDEWLPTVEENRFWTGLLKRLMGGYKLSVAADKANECIIATLICNVHGSPDAGWCLTARADEVFSALMLLFWKDEVLLQGSWVLNGKARNKRKFG